MGCPIIDKGQVARLACLDVPDRFLVSVDGQHLEEIMSLHQPPDHAFCSAIRLLYRARHKLGFPHFIGVTVDRCNKCIKSYLVKWPDTACRLLLDGASDFSLPQPWLLVEQWSRQLLERIGEVHAQGHVVGQLRNARPPVLVDALNQIHLARFQTRVDLSPDASPFYPPEFRHLARSAEQGSTRAEALLVTPAFDVYQCGQILWMLAAGWASGDKTALDFKEDFYKPPELCDRGFWLGLSPLPRLPSTVPELFQDVIDA